MIFSIPIIIIMKNDLEQQQKNGTQGLNERLNVQKNDDGFSCDDELQNQIVYEETNDWKQLIEIDDERVKMKIGPVREISKKSYSLEPDMITGWAPKSMFCRPIPLTFQNWHIDGIVDYYIKLPKSSKQKIQLCYLGARYETTYYAWYEKKFQFPYKHLSAPKNIKITDRFFCGQHWDAENQEFLLFDSLFEGGNLDAVFKVGRHQYDLFMRVDSNTQGHLQWFNFKVKNFEPGSIYKFNICNFQKGKSLYSRGMSPYFYSAKRFINQGIEWTQFNGQSKYRKKICKAQKILDFESDDCNYVLTFKFNSEYPSDEVQFCYCVPYNYSTLLEKLKLINEKYEKQNFLKIKKLCSSLGGLQIPEITFTQDATMEEQYSKRKKKIEGKKVIIITGRCHPGEANGSWMVDGLLDYLCSGLQDAEYLRKNAIIKIIPMLNPDGVILGNYRTGLSGRDFNREFVNPDKDIFPQIYSLKQLMRKYKQIYQEQVLFYLDFHGHSVKKNVFAYGPEYSIIHKNYYESRMILKLISSKTNMFRYHSCIFKISQHKQKTGRAICQRNIKIPFSYTIQASNGLYYDHQELKSQLFDIQKWRKTGQSVLKGIAQYLKLLQQLDNIRKKKMRERQMVKMKINREKIKSTSKKSGTYTSLGFRKPKQLGSNSEQFSFMSMFSNLQVKKQKLSSLVEEIRLESTSRKEEQILASDDEISEGSSDSEKSADDLSKEQITNLFKFIKKKGNSSSKMKFKDKKNSRMENVKTTYNEEEEEEEDSLKQEKNKVNNQKEANLRKYFWKKKNSMCTTPSPKKQQSGVTAKIVNFSFSLQPTDIGLMNKTHNAYKNQDKKVEKFQKSHYNNNPSSCTQLSLARKSAKSYQYSETFKKSFISVQKQILRRESHKRYLVTVNNFVNQSKQKPNYLIENFNSRRIKTEND